MFKHISIIPAPHNPLAEQITQRLLVSLKNHGVQAAVNDFKGDLIITVGGDGTLLRAARQAVHINRPILGINAGHLGFLASIPANQLDTILPEVLSGQYDQDKRVVLQVTVLAGDKPVFQGVAINEVVVYSDDMAKIVELDVFIDGFFVNTQRSDGLIVCTPTGSTAYALSAGGPLLAPHVSAFGLVPISPHQLSSRPLVVPSTSTVEIIPKSHRPTRISCDSQVHHELHMGNRVHVTQFTEKLVLIHPKSEDYFSVLRNKLGWSGAAPGHFDTLSS